MAHEQINQNPEQEKVLYVAMEAEPGATSDFCVAPEGSVLPAY